MKPPEVRTTAGLVRFVSQVSGQNKSESCKQPARQRNRTGTSLPPETGQQRLLKRKACCPNEEEQATGELRKVNSILSSYLKGSVTVGKGGGGARFGKVLACTLRRPFLT